jgi:hypothetical protein
MPAKRFLDVSSPAAGGAEAYVVNKKIKIEGEQSTPVINPYASALADLHKEFKQEGSGRFEFRREGREWRIWCCLCKNLNQVGPGPRKLGNFKKQFTSKKHLDLLSSAKEDASAK